MALNFRSVFKFLGKATKFVPGVGTTISQAIDLVVPDKTNPSVEDREKALKLLEKIRAVKPSIASSEFTFAAAAEGALTTIVYTESMPDMVRAVAAFGMAAIPLGYMYVRMRAKEKKAEKS